MTVQASPVKRVPTDQVVQLMKQRFEALADVSVTGMTDTVTLSRPKRVQLNLVLHDNEHNATSALVVPGKIVLNMARFEPSRSFHEADETRVFRLESFNDFSRVLDSLEELLQFDPAYQVRGFTAPDFFVHAERQVFRANVISAASVERVVYVDLKKGEVHETEGSGEPWFRVSCTFSTFVSKAGISTSPSSSSSFQLLYNGEGWLLVHSDGKHLTNRRTLLQTIPISELTSADEALLKHLMEYFISKSM